MNNLLNETKEGASQFKSTYNYALDFFSKAGSIFTTDKKQSFYNEDVSIDEMFQSVWLNDKELALKLLFWLRDCRGGAGNRSSFKHILRWVAKQHPNYLKDNLELIPLYGRWDDLTSLFNTPLEAHAAKLWCVAINEQNVLAAKWADRKMKPIQKEFGINEAQLRKVLSYIRKNHIVEHKMCSKDWSSIKYDNVPSVAMARYAKAFKKNDDERFTKFKMDVAIGKVKINTGALFPHDCVRTARNGDTETANLQFDNLPQYFDPKDERIMCLCDSSGSMSIQVSGSVTAYDVSTGLSLYCSNMVGKDNPFYRKFIAFESESKFVDWSKYSFGGCFGFSNRIFDGAVGSTRIDLALKLILDSALMWNVKQEQLPTTLLIISDMQFTNATGTNGFDRIYDYRPKVKDHDTEVNKVLDMFVEKGYNPPKIVYWNVANAGYSGSPETVEPKFPSVLVSGFSPSILKAVFECDEESFKPVNIMLKTLEKYKVNMP